MLQADIKKLEQGRFLINISIKFVIKWKEKP